MSGNPSSDYLYIFLDEGGNLDFSPKGTKYFVLTSVTSGRPFPWDGELAALKYDLIEYGLDIEYFHAAEDRQPVRDRVFEIIALHLSGIRLDSIIVEKRKTGPAMRREERFFPEMIGYLLRYVINGYKGLPYREVIVTTDSLPVRSKRKAVEKAVKTTLARMLPAEIRYRVLHHASKSCGSLQVADYCNWAIFRKWEIADERSHILIKSGLRSEYDIFRSGQRIYY